MRRRMGNTLIRQDSVFRVRIISVNLEKRTVEASWNNNPARVYRERDVKKWRLKEPQLKHRGIVG